MPVATIRMIATKPVRVPYFAETVSVAALPHALPPLGSLYKANRFPPGFLGDVTTRPFRRDSLFPAVDSFEILSWKSTALALLAEAGQLREPPEFRGVAPFLLLPFAGEEAPLPEERFVADVEIALGGKRRGWEEKVSIVLLEDADDLLDLGYAGAGHSLYLCHFGSAAGDLPVGRDVAEQQKETPRDVSLFRIVLNFIPSGIGVEREGHFDSACGLVVFGLTLTSPFAPARATACFHVRISACCMSGS